MVQIVVKTGKVNLQQTVICRERQKRNPNKQAEGQNPREKSKVANKQGNGTKQKLWQRNGAKTMTMEQTITVAIMKQGKWLVESAQARQYFTLAVWHGLPYMAPKQEVTREAAEGATTGGWGNRGKTGGGMEGQVRAEEVGLDRGAGTDSEALKDLGPGTVVDSETLEGLDRGVVADSGTLEDLGRGAVADSGTLEDQGRGAVADSGTLEDLGRGTVVDSETLEGLGRGAVADSGTLEDLGRGIVVDSETLEQKSTMSDSEEPGTMVEQVEQEAMAGQAEQAAMAGQAGQAEQEAMVGQAEQEAMAGKAEQAAMVGQAEQTGAKIPTVEQMTSIAEQRVLDWPPWP
ncbi:hypothetical protein M9458_053494 [Cirrhinus mrigala]|uniref:Uncharacterized protein n=1 Tax=Cirrhinus mrigala TaxID=683832 RepID=A0ABD0MQ80_CIRMR